MPALRTPAPDFRLPGVLAGTRGTWSLADGRGRWTVLFFYPRDFTFICPTEIRGFEGRIREFRAADSEVLGVSGDDPETHARWAAELGGLSYPLLSDAGHRVTRSYDAFDPVENVPLRATFIIGPDLLLRYAVTSDLTVGRSVEETLRVLEALRTGRLCPADWRPGGETADPSRKF
jgi:alkyl hydroperoxide reductase subunit AhpC